MSSQEIFELSFNVRDILAELGYSYEIAPLTLPRMQLTSLTVVDQVSQHMEKRCPRVSLDSGSGHREFHVLNQYVLPKDLNELLSILIGLMRP